ncbi:glycosyltransferase [Paludibaculum fermentans]|uniref:glycosyltransferase n=1 Tax=Paludibaculum fermentans TaxID=1473598 RepID=UPI003EC0EC55
MTTLFNRVYYTLKPVIPRRVSLAARRWWSSRLRAANSSAWPIDVNAGATPPGWPGWPDGKRFAFVLTHDVEGTKGLERCQRLMELDARYGFRSAFNFVPEEEYRVSDALRQQLTDSGFEVGVHGLGHEGKLYFSKSGFQAKAARIHSYLERWNASGFRSPLMQHNLAWLHQLGAEYDSSTFDTDPFEPEPDGVSTIFPFWVAGPAGTGFVELPYTLAQDHTLFTVLREPGIDIWKRKLDWIAARGGMALLNTHPDYMSFDGAPAWDEFPVSHYEDLLRYVRDRYDGAVWSALPRDVARFYTSALPRGARNSRRKICMVTYSNYESANRVRRYAEALACRGDQVEVISLSTGDTPLGEDEINGVRVFRIQRRRHDERGKWTYALRLARFLLAASLLLFRRHRQLRYDLIHIHNIPDFMVFAAWYPKWTGVKVILDIHDIVPELFANKFKARSGALYFRLLKFVEKVSTAFADHVIIANHIWFDRITGRSVPSSKCGVFLNHVDPAIFFRRTRTRTDSKFVLLFHGTFQWHQGLEIAVEALAKIRETAPHVELHLYGGGGGADAVTHLSQLADRLGLNGSVKFCGTVPLHEIPQVIANADLGIVPKRADSFGNEACSTKIMEFMSQGIPVVASRTRIDTYYHDDRTVRFFTSGDSQAMAEAVLDIIRNPPLGEALAKAGLQYVEENSWDKRKQEYLALVDSLTTEVFS